MTPVYTRLLSEAQYGQVQIYESWLVILQAVLSLYLVVSIDVAKHDFRGEYDAYVSGILALSHCSILFFSVAGFLFKADIQSFFGIDELMFYFGVIYLFTSTGMSYFQRKEKQMLRYKSSTALTFLTLIPSTLLSVVLLYSGSRRGLTEQLVDRRIAGYYFPMIIGGLAASAAIYLRGKTCYEKRYWRYAFVYSLPLIPEHLSIVIMNQSDKIMVGRLSGDRNAGIFSLASILSYVIWVLLESFWSSWVPWLYEKIARKEEQDVEKPWIVVMHLFGLFSWVIVILAPEVIALLGPEKYREAKWLVAPMVTGVLLRFFSYSFSAVQKYYKKTKSVATGTVVAMVLNVFLNYVCILRFGYMAAAYTTSFSFLVLMVIQGILEYRTTGRLLVSLKKSLGIGMFYGCLNIGSTWLYYLPFYIRYLLFGMIAAILFITQRKRISEMLTLVVRVLKS